MNNQTIVHGLLEGEASRLAADINTPPDILNQLARHENEFVRATVAANKSTSRSTLDYLSKDKSSWVTGFLNKRAESEAALLSIHPTSIIHPNARIGSNVVVGPYTIIHENVDIGDDTVIGCHCEIGHPAHVKSQGGTLVIGKNSYIRSHSIFYEGSTFGEGLVTGHRVTVREQTMAGRGLQIGTLSDIQGHCSFGDFVKMHSNVHIGQHSKIKSYVWIFPYVVLTNDPHPPSEVMMGVTVEDYVAIATMSVILPGVRIQQGALIGAHSSVSKDVNPDTVVAGVPAKYICNTNEIKMRDGSGVSAYPWRRHFHQGYLPDIVEKWKKEFSDTLT